MSYILEALKKAQAERQLGSAPTIHALPVEPVNADRAGRARAPLWAGLALAVLALGAIAVVALRPAQVAAPVVAIAPAPAPAVVIAAVAPPAMPAIVTPPAPAPAPAPVVAPPRPAPVVKAVAPVAVMPAPAAPAAPQAALKPPPSPPPAPSPAAEDVAPFQQGLPEAIQRVLPQIAVGGYIYSKNPADRLLLIDKVLRHEGEEVAPGLILEKLLPKAALMNYRGYRYRIAY